MRPLVSSKMGESRHSKDGFFRHTIQSDVHTVIIDTLSINSTVLTQHAPRGPLVT